PIQLHRCWRSVFARRFPRGLVFDAPIDYRRFGQVRPIETILPNDWLRLSAGRTRGDYPRRNRPGAGRDGDCASSVSGDRTMTAIPQAAIDGDAGRLDASHLALLAGTFIVTFDFYVVNLALPAIAVEFGSSAALTQWVVTGFGLVYGAGLLVGSRIGERFGPTRSFRIGLVLFLAGSTACALSTGAGLLVAARCAQGAGAALLSPQVMSLLGRLAPDALRLRGFAGYGVALGLGSGLGQVIGGLLV